MKLIGRQLKVYRSHPPVVVVLIFVPWFYEGKGAIIACQVSSKANQHLSQECRLIHKLQTTQKLTKHHKLRL